MALPAPVLLLLGPLLGGLAIVWLRRWRWPTAVAGAMVAWGLWLMVTAVPLQPSDIELATRLFAGDTFTLWQQPFVLTESTRSLMLLMYAAGGILFLLSGLWPQGYNFVPVALAALAPLAAALLSRPFTFAVIFLWIAIAFLVLLIQAERAGSVRPALRYLLIGLLATCLLLTAAWMITPEQTGLQTIAARLLAVAFAMLTAGFPFYIWVIPVANHSPMLARVFVLGLAPLIITTFLFEMLQNNPWLYQETQFFLWLRWSGLLTVVVAGLSALTTNRRHLLGALVLLDMGIVILALALRDRETAVTLHLARTVALLLAGIGLQQDGRWPRLLFIVGCASLLGLPLTPGFFSRWAIISQSPDVWFALLLLLGLTGGLSGWWYNLTRGNFSIVAS